MATVNIADARAHLSELVGQVEAGETIDFLRRGKLAARLVPAETPRKPIDIAALRKLTQGCRYRQNPKEFLDCDPAVFCSRECRFRHQVVDRQNNSLCKFTNCPLPVC
ncbi:type II toxin-antitoxin system Phd/YefM family antitoxin [Phyllobacterium endophyticum]|uniref:type II toxin-antitoxin system Phd/YefM family antitoxin n=1 Tax=Phyllobacterium endophyticum TaxID=1149773 RepID=UPI0011CADD88|nr:type II toxin-antitoxin system Phd/YefM family antitoxin [Phyllobacterium endophyticum]TXR50611.1 hypothetical protein FVA77_01925 [Phyllobacterium endophyticum]